MSVAFRHNYLKFCQDFGEGLYNEPWIIFLRANESENILRIFLSLCNRKHPSDFGDLKLTICPGNLRNGKILST